MTGQPIEKELDASPLVTTLIEKSMAGKLKWEPTAREGEFIASVGGDTTLKISLTSGEGLDVYGQPETYQVPVLWLVDAKGRSLWEIEQSQVKGGLWNLYKLAQRIANKLDEKVAALVEVLQKL